VKPRVRRPVARVLAAIHSRATLSTEGVWVATKFNNSITRGFGGGRAAERCGLPAAWYRDRVRRDVECEPPFRFGILSNKKIGQRLARLRLGRLISIWQRE
jgi:hypothetical protein